MAKARRGTGNRNNSHKTVKGENKRTRMKLYTSRDMDQIWKDDLEGAKGDPKVENKAYERATDIVGGGEHYCTQCSKYFQTASVLLDHKKTKSHKRRVRDLKAEIPYGVNGEADVYAAAGKGAPDNGKKLAGSFLRAADRNQPSAMVL